MEEKTNISADPTVKADTVKTTPTNCPNCGAAITEENNGEFCVYCKTRLPKVVADSVTNNVVNNTVNEYHTTNIYQSVSPVKTQVSAAAKNRSYINTIVGVGLMTAVVVVLQLLSSVIRFGPFSITLALTAMIVGGAVYGIWAGAWLGFTMGMTVLLSGDAAAFLAIDAFGTILTVLLKGALAGFAAALVYKLLEKLSRFGAVIAAGVTAPVVNTGIFLLGSYLFFYDTISEWALGSSLPVGEYIFTVLIGLNFPVELMVNLALSTVTVSIIGIVRKSMASD